MSSVLSKDTSDCQTAAICCVLIGISKADCSGSVLYALKRNIDGCFEGDPFQLRQENGLYIWPNEKIAVNRISFGSILRCRKFGDIYTYLGSTKRRKMNVEQVQMELVYGVNVYRSIEEVCPNAVLGKQKGLYMKTKPDKPKIILVSLKSGTIKNERIHFQTKGDDHTIDLKLNCRKHLTLSTAPVILQTRKVTDEEDVGDLALIKFGTADVSLRSPIYPAVCEGLILKFRPHVISIDEELVKIRNGDGKCVLVKKVKLDTGNDGGTAISSGLVQKLGLEPDRSKKSRMVGIGGPVECFKVKISIYIRKRCFKVNALVDAVAPETDLLIGNDIMAKLDKENYTIGQ